MIWKQNTNNTLELKGESICFIYSEIISLNQYNIFMIAILK